MMLKSAQTSLFFTSAGPFKAGTHVFPIYLPPAGPAKTANQDLSKSFQPAAPPHNTENRNSKFESRTHNWPEMNFEIRTTPKSFPEIYIRPSQNPSPKKSVEHQIIQDFIVVESILGFTHRERGARSLGLAFSRLESFRVTAVHAHQGCPVSFRVVSSSILACSYSFRFVSFSSRIVSLRFVLIIQKR